MTNPNGNLLGGSTSAPSVKFPTIGTRHVMKVTAWPSQKQSKNFETGQPEFWPDGQPKKVILVEVEIDGVAHALWVTPGTALYAAINEAQQAAGQEVGPGGTLTVEHTHSVPSSKGAHLAPAKQFKAEYQPGPGAFSAAASDGFDTAPAAAAPATQAAAPQPGVTYLPADKYAALAAVPGADMSGFAVQA